MVKTRETVVVPAPYKKQRITSIDALRAVTLLGIAVVHSHNGFGMDYDAVAGPVDGWVSAFIKFFLINKCNSIFGMLFGVSFYLILRNPANTSAKFAWRCLLLIVIGLINKIFYTFDALMWYGMCGIVLSMMRRWKASVILTGAVVLIIFSAMVKHMGHSFGAYFFGDELGTRYGPDKTLLDVITYRHAVRDYLQLALGVETLAKFMIGFGIAKMGIIENIERYANRRTLVVAWIIFAVSFVLVVLASNVFTTKLNNYVGSLTYAITVLYCYYRFSHLRKVLQLLEPYGKCGLTNYSVQGITGVFVMGSFGLGLWRYDLMAVLVVSLVIYVLQAVFCYWWLKRYKYGPLEYLWRVGTERKLFALRRE